MGSHGIKKDQEGLKFRPVDLTLLYKLVKKGHKRSDGGIILKGLIIAVHLFDRLVDLCVQVLRILIPIRKDLLQPPYTLKETSAASYTLIAPGCGKVEGSYEHFIGP